MPDEEIDISPMFPDFDKVTAEVYGGVAHLKLWSGGTYAMLKVTVAEVYNALTKLRRKV